MLVSKKNRKVLGAVVALMCISISVNAQETLKQQSNGTQKTRVAPAVSPFVSGVPRLGFMGQMINGHGMRVVSTSYGTPAYRAGLEHGDVIFYIGGRRILCKHDYDTALMDAVLVNGGFVSMVVRNVRFDMGLSFQEFVTVSTYLDGYAVPAAGGGAPVVSYKSKANGSLPVKKGLPKQPLKVVPQQKIKLAKPPLKIQSSVKKIPKLKPPILGK